MFRSLKTSLTTGLMLACHAFLMPERHIRRFADGLMPYVVTKSDTAALAIKKGDPSLDKVALNVTTGGPGEVRHGRMTDARKRGSTARCLATPLRTPDL